MRNELERLLSACGACKREFGSNVALYAAEDGNLTEDQVVWVLEHLKRLHKVH